MKKGVRIIWVILVFLLFATFGVANDKNEKAVVFYNARQIPTFHFTNLTPEQKALLEVRHTIQGLITQTYDDELHGIVDLKKYDQIHSLVAKLPSSGTLYPKKGKWANESRR